MIPPLAADVCACLALGSLAALWRQDRTEPVCLDLVLALGGVGLVLALF